MFARLKAELPIYRGTTQRVFAFAERSDLRIVHEYINEHLTGANDKRTQFLQMIEDRKRNGFQYVIVYQLDRFARNRDDSTTYKEILKQDYEELNNRKR